LVVWALDRLTRQGVEETFRIIRRLRETAFGCGRAGVISTSVTSGVVAKSLRKAWDEAVERENEARRYGVLQ
jgi:hypothetical protein